MLSRPGDSEVPLLRLTIKAKSGQALGRTPARVVTGPGKSRPAPRARGCPGGTPGLFAGEDAYATTGRREGCLR